MPRLPVLAFLLVAVTALVACGGATPAQTPAPTRTPTPPATATPGPSGTAKVLRADVPRVSPADVSDTELSSLADGANAFAFDLYRQVGNAARFREKNLFFSPLSIYLAFAMTSLGAAGTTADQMASTLQFGLPAGRLHPALNLLDQKLAGNEAFELEIANSLWGQDGLAFRQQFLEGLSRDYGAGMRLVDFVDARNRETARQEINHWVEDTTNDRIKDLVPPGVLTEMTRLVLANAIYFKADWQFQFPGESTASRRFVLADGTRIDVPTMTRGQMPLRYARLGTSQVVEMPYEGEGISMLIVLPDAGQFEALEGSIDAGFLSTALDSLESRAVSVTMPKFEFTSEIGLKEHLVALGMRAPFDPGQADFSGIADPATTPLYIQDALHKAFVKVDEEGTEAAAATAVIVGTTSMPVDVVDFVVDRPFLFLIRHGDSGTTLFVGRVTDPR